MSVVVAGDYARAISKGLRELLTEVGDGGRRLQRELGISRSIARRRAMGMPRTVFIWIPKTAGTSLWDLQRRAGGQIYLNPTIARQVFPNQGIVTFGHIRYSDLRGKGIVSDEFHYSAYKFCVVRNPFDRTVSLFHYLKSQRLIPALMSFDLFSALLREGSYEQIGLYSFRGLSQCNPQLDWITDAEGQLIVDDIGRFENLEPLLESLHDRLGIDTAMPSLNSSPDRREYRSYYGKASTRRNVEKVYAADLDKFDYDF